MKRPGEVEFKPRKEGLIERIGFEIGGMTLAALAAYAMVFALIILGGFMILIVSAIDSCGSKPQVQTQATPTPMIFRQVPGAIFVPSSPTRIAGSFGVFQVHGSDAENASVIAFTYEDIHVIVVRTTNQIPAADLAAAEQFIGGRSGRRIQMRDPGSLLQLGFLKENASFPRVAGQVESDGRVERTPYVIVGDVDIVCGSLVNQDSALADFFLEKDEIKTARLTFGVREMHPVRTVYVVGSIKSFVGPTQLGSSFTATHILDLTATQKELAEFRDRREKYLNEIDFLARIHGVTPWELLEHEGTQVQVNRGGFVGTRVVPVGDSESTSSGGKRAPGERGEGLPPKIEPRPEPKEVPIR